MLPDINEGAYLLFKDMCLWEAPVAQIRVHISEQQMKKAVLVLLVSFGLVSTAMAHSGGTDSNGCHTNSKTGDYHCHTPK